MERKGQESLPGFSEVEILRSLKVEELLDYKAFLLERYTDLERQVNLVNAELDKYGIELEEG